MRGEGVVKFEAVHRQGALPAPLVRDVVDELLGWRTLLFDLGLLGQSPARYDGAAYGNVSARLAPFDAPPGRRAFLVTGTQTSGLRDVGGEGLCVVSAYDYARNVVESAGRSRPSSEAMTHGAAYDVAPSTRFVFHVHAPVLWRARAVLGLPETRPGIEYGTPEMALEVARLYRTTPLRTLRLFAMAGHEDGVVSFGVSAREAAMALLDCCARAERARG